MCFRVCHVPNCVGLLVLHNHEETGIKEKYDATNIHFLEALIKFSFWRFCRKEIAKMITMSEFDLMNSGRRYLGCFSYFFPSKIWFAILYNLRLLMFKCKKFKHLTLSLGAASVAQLDAPSDWRPGGRGFNPRRGRQHSFVEIDHEIFSTVILSLPLIQEEQLSVSGERMCTILVNRLED